MTEQMLELLTKAKNARGALENLDSETRENIMLDFAEKLEEEADYILAENAKDLENAKGKVPDVMLDRLRLTKERIKAMAQGVIDVCKLPDPRGILEEIIRPNGLKIQKVAVPLGVLAVIYESRPNVTSDVIALCFKSGNVCVLRGGKEAFHSSYAIVSLFREIVRGYQLPEAFATLVEDLSRGSATELMQAVGYVDALIPRGGKGLIDHCVQNAKVPCIQTGTGICHVYVDRSADQEKALAIVENAKCSRPSVCNAAEVCLVDEKIAAGFLPKLKKKLVDDRIANSKQPVELRLCEKAQKIIDGTPACESDFDTEFLDYILAVKVLPDVGYACTHISKHSTGHSEAIVAEDDWAKGLFVRYVNSAAVYVNASTRFTDGGEFGKGCEIGISTQKVHARGPMGLKELMSYKYRIWGDGQIR